MISVDRPRGPRECTRLAVSGLCTPPEPVYGEPMQKTARRWWHRLIGKDDKFFELLQAGANEAHTSVTLLSAYLEAVGRGQTPPQTSDFAESRRRQKQIRSQTIEHLYSTLMPPFEREDIQALAFAVYRIPKVVEKLVERMALYPGRLPVAVFQRQARLLTTAADALVFMFQQLQAGLDIEKINAANDRLQAAEGEADKMMLAALSELYQSTEDPKQLVILQSFYELMERAVDRCRDAGSIIVQIAMKNA